MISSPLLSFLSFFSGGNFVCLILAVVSTMQLPLKDGLYSHQCTLTLLFPRLQANMKITGIPIGDIACGAFHSSDL